VPEIARILVYPIKSLDGVVLSRATVLQSGGLQYDREFALVDPQGRFINGKRNAQVHSLRSFFDIATRTIAFPWKATDEPQTFWVDHERPAIEAWLSNYFGMEVRLVQSLVGFPDDTDASGPTIISTATLEVVASWFPGISADEMRLRLRSNIELKDVPPFWEDQLFAAAGSVVQFQLGDVRFEGMNPCQRCVVPTRNPLSGEAYAKFQKIFSQNRRETLPSWTELSRFNHFFRLAVNTRVPRPQGGKTLQIGDSVKILGVTENKPS